MCKHKGSVQGICLSIAVLLMLTVWVAEGRCQDKYPTREIELINPYAPGGAVDRTGRIVAEWLKKKWSVPLNMINKTGGMSIPANLEVLNAKPDGYTLLADTQASSSMLEFGGVQLPFKVLDRQFIAIYAFVQPVFAVPANSPIKNLKDLEAEVKKDPGNFTWNSTGRGSSTDLDFKGFLKEFNFDISKTKAVASRGGGEAVTLIAGGHIKLGMSTASSFLPAIQAGTIRAIAVRGKDRHPDLPEVPTAAEQGYPYLNSLPLFWMGVTGPAKLPSYVTDTWNKALQEIFADPEFISKMKAAGTVPTYLNSRQAREYVESEIKAARELWGAE